MKLSDLKYLLAYTLPLTGFISIFYGGLWSWTTVIYAFIFIPIAEYLLPEQRQNLSAVEYEEKSKSSYFEVLLFINLPVLLTLIYFALEQTTSPTIKPWEQIGIILSIGIVMGGNGINVAHELGHKQGAIYNWAAKLLLTPCLYNHFTIEHNRGHHLNVGTPKDPATSRKNEWLYKFWFRSTIQSYINAWKLETKKLKIDKKNFISIHNEMIINTLITAIYLCGVFYVFGSHGVWVSVGMGIVSFLLLETINYIEHYGLERKILDNGLYEKVETIHSWNSDHYLGRIILYELTRHSDHHYKANKKYQTLLHYDESPQLPLGYPGSMLLAAVPPLWFSVMNNKLK